MKSMKQEFLENRGSQVMYEHLLPWEFVERINACPVAYLPLGTLEWHGKHLPFGSDGIQPRGVFERLATIVGGIVLPMLFVGPDTCKKTATNVYYAMDCHSFEEGQEQQLAGNAYYIDEEQFISLLHTVMANLARAGFKAVVAHGHGPSTHVFTACKQSFLEEYGILTYNLWELGVNGDDGIQTDHAATNETSLVMAIAPDLVDMEQLANDEIPLGVWGRDPRTYASRSEGERIIQKNVELAAKALEAIVADLPAPNLSLDYHSAKSLLR